jgi:hypothetical protein
MSSLVIAGAFTSGAWAVDAGQSEDQEEVKGNYARLEQQHMVVVVLADQYNKELAELRRMEAVFADHYDLDVKKWRNNKYIWNDKEKKFLLKPKEEKVPKNP